MTQRKGNRDASVVELQADEVPWDIKFSDIRIGLLHLIYAFKSLL